MEGPFDADPDGIAMTGQRLNLLNTTFLRTPLAIRDRACG